MPFNRAVVALGANANLPEFNLVDINIVHFINRAEHGVDGAVVRIIYGNDGSFNYDLDAFHKPQYNQWARGWPIANIGDDYLIQCHIIEGDQPADIFPFPSDDLDSYLALTQDRAWTWWQFGPGTKEAIIKVDIADTEEVIVASHTINLTLLVV